MHVPQQKSAPISPSYEPRELPAYVKTALQQVSQNDIAVSGGSLISCGPRNVHVDTYVRPSR